MEEDEPGCDKPKGVLEYGVVAVLKKNFGFIKCCSRPQDMFFHIKDLDSSIQAEELRPGLEVQFSCSQEAVAGGRQRACARQLTRAPPGTALFESFSQQQHVGLVLEAALATALKQTPGVIRFISGEREEVRHVLFMAADVVTQAPAEASAQVLFRLVTNVKAAALMANSSGSSGSGSGSEAKFTRAAEVQVLEAEAVGAITWIL